MFENAEKKVLLAIQLTCCIIATVKLSLQSDTKTVDIAHMNDSQLRVHFERLVVELKRGGYELAEHISIEQRWSVFLPAAQRMREHNQRSEHFKQKPSAHHVLTESEKRPYRPCRYQGNWGQQQQPEWIQCAEPEKNQRTAEPPASADNCWFTGPVENQGACGSCAVFAASHALAGRMLLRDWQWEEARAVRLSEQQGVDCAAPAYVPTGDRDICANGSLPEWTWRMYERDGADTDARDPYTAQYVQDDAECKVDIGGNRVEPHFAPELCRQIAPGDVNAMKWAVADGPVSIAMQVSFEGEEGEWWQTDFAYAMSGVYSDEARQCKRSIEALPDHEMVACGYGHDTASGKDYWLVKNSWGRRFGEGGYVKVEMGKDICFIESYAQYPVLDKGAKTTNTKVCEHAAPCTTDADCNRIAHACVYGACACYAQCDERRVCDTDEQCGSVRGACRMAQPWPAGNRRCWCAAAAGCVDGAPCEHEAHCDWIAGACVPYTTAWWHGEEIEFKRCSCA